jgi:hypothetical protein
MSTEEFGFDNEDVKYAKFQPYKGKKGVEERVGIVFEDIKTAVKSVKCYYNQRYFLHKEDPEFVRFMESKNQVARTRMGCLLIIYQFDPTGVKLVGYRLIPWVFKEKMYSSLRSVNKEFPLADHDLKLKCTNEQFQNIEVTPCKDSIWRKNEKLRDKILAEASVHFDQIKKNLASDLTLTEVKELFGAAASGTDDAAADANLGDIAENL